MAHATFNPGDLKPLLKDARKNILKAIEVEKAREDKENKWLRSRLYYPMSDEYLDTLWEIGKINTLVHNAESNVTLTADEYIKIKHWADWKE